MNRLLQLRMPRKGSSILEMGFAITIMLMIVIAIWLIASGLWTRATLESTAAVAAINGQAAYNRVRFAPNVNDTVAQGREAEAQRQARQAANTVVNYALTRKQADIMGLVAVNSCLPPGGVTSNPDEIAPSVPPGLTTEYAGNAYLKRRISILPAGGGGQDMLVRVDVVARWQPANFPVALVGSGAAVSGCVYGTGAAIARKAQ